MTVMVHVLLRMIVIVMMDIMAVMNQLVQLALILCVVVMVNVQIMGYMKMMV